MMLIEAPVRGAGPGQADPCRTGGARSEPLAVDELSWLLWRAALADSPKLVSSRARELAVELLEHLRRQGTQQVFDDGCNEPLELLLLAHRVHALADPDRLIECLDEAADHPVESDAFGGEPSRQRALFVRRLHGLRRSTELRSRYRELLYQSWSCLEPAWRESTPLLERRAAAIEQKIADSASPFEVIGERHAGSMRILRCLVGRAWDLERLTIAPSLLASDGGGAAALPGGAMVLSVTHDPHPSSVPAIRESARRNAKVLSDVAVPERLAILASLCGPRTADELEFMFGYSPAAISRHLKILRRHGLIESRRSGASTYHVASPGAFHAYLEAVGQEIEALIADPRAAVQLSPR